jgi:DNA polymerase III subunit epsilon
VSDRAKFAGALAAGYGLLLGLLAFCAAALWSGLEQAEQMALLRILDERGGLIGALGAIVLVTLGIVMHILYSRYVVLPRRLAEGVQIILTGNPVHRLAPTGPGELRRLAACINELAARAAEQQAQVQARIDAATVKIDEERNRLAALMSELSLSVLVCNREGRILLYNSRAKTLLDQPEAGASYVGLGRSVISVIERNQIAHAQECIDERIAKGESNPVANFVTSMSAGKLARVQMAPVRSGGGTQTGFVLTLEDITAAIEAGARRDALLQDLTEGNRPALANMRAAVETVTTVPGMDADQRNAFLAIISEEADRLSANLERAMKAHGDMLRTQWPLEEMNGVDLLSLAQRQIDSRVGLESQCESVDPAVWLNVDSYSLTLALTSIAQRLRDELNVSLVRFRLAGSGRLANLDMVWSGTRVTAGIFKEWEIEALRVGAEVSLLTLRDVIERHGGEAWYQYNRFEGTGCYRLTIPLVPVSIRKTVPVAVGRPEYYDFDLFSQSEQSAELDPRLLTDLGYTVFDTETTGLDPSAGDEIISIGAVRIVNNRLLRQEIFDQLVDPRRPIAPDATAVHGIDAAMVAGHQTIERVLPAFAQFCEETVLVAHNASFDMRFLQLKEAATGVRFTQPVLDTLLLSAVIHPEQQEHGLEAVAARLGVNVMGRHTALGDALVTGEIFVKMLPFLAAKGIHTLKQAREAAQKTYYARLAY